MATGAWSGKFLLQYLFCFVFSSPSSKINHGIATIGTLLEYVVMTFCQPGQWSVLSAVQDLHCHCGLLSITALAEGQTLTSAEIVIFAELVWTPGTIDQCEGRAHRIGQQGSVLIQYLLLQDSEVDRRCYQQLGGI